MTDYDILSFFFSAKNMNPKTCFLFGSFLIVLGLAAAFNTVFATYASMAILATLVITRGAIQLANGFIYRSLSEHSRWITNFSATFYLIGGAAIIDEPETGSTLLTAILAGCFVIAGLTRAFWASRHRQFGGWGLLTTSGFFTLLIGLLLYLSIPLSSSWLLGALIAIELVVAGFASVLLGFMINPTSE